MDRAAFSMAAANVLHSKSTHWRHLKIGEFGMKTLRKIILPFALLLLSGSAIFGADKSAPTEKTFDAPNDLKVSVKMIGPYSEPADLQIICLFQHKSSGDTYQGAAKDTDEHLNGLLSALRNRGEFVGELGETILFTPANGSIPAKRFMVIGLGEEKDLSLDALHLVGRLAAREAVRLQAKRVAWRRSSAMRAIRLSMSAKATGRSSSKCSRLMTPKSVCKHKNLRPRSALKLCDRGWACLF